MNKQIENTWEAIDCLLKAMLVAWIITKTIQGFVQENKMTDPILTLLLIALILQVPHLSKDFAAKLGWASLLGAVVLFILGLFV